MANLTAFALELRMELGVLVRGGDSPRRVRMHFEDLILPEPKAVEHRADLVIRLEDAQSKPVLGVVVEVQLSINPDKLFSWPVYGVCLRERLKCNTLVLIVTSEESVAQWAASPIGLGGRSVYDPVVLGPSQIPVIREPGPPPEECVLSAMVRKA